MMPPAISAEVVHLALRAVRSGQSLQGSPLLALRALGDALAAARLPDSPESRESHLPTWLDAVVAEHLHQGPATGGADGEAWAVLHAYYFSGNAGSQRDLTAGLPISFITARRRLERGYQLLADVLHAKEQAAVRSEARARTVPRPYTRFIGREAELGHIRRLMAGHRCVVLAGPGGVGKSRLAIRLARDLSDDYPDDAWFVEIAALSEGRQVTQAVMAALGARESPGQRPADTLAEHIADKRLLLVIDNGEHLAEACGSLIAHLLAHCGQLQVLATSRVELPVTGAKHWLVPPMALPADVADIPPGGLIQFDAPRLFGARAAVAKADFTLTDATAGPVGRICARLDGLPLAIELAAARVAELSLDQLETRLADRFALLKDGRRATRRSHETLQAMMDWSYDLLSEPEKRLLRRLSVFRGGWTLEAAEEVCAGEGVEAGDVAGLLNRLEAKSLVQARESERDRRWDMLETVREYALDRLEEARELSDIRMRHLTFFVRLAEQARSSSANPSDEAWLDVFEVDHHNFIQALRWTERLSDACHGLKLCAAMWQYWYYRGHWAEGRIALEQVLSIADQGDVSAAHAGARRGLGVFLQHSGRLAEARDQYLLSMEVYEALGDDVGLAWIHTNLGRVAEALGALDEACDRYRLALAAFTTLDDTRGQIVVLQDLGVVATNRSRYAEARSYLLPSLELAERVGHQRAIAFAIQSLGIIAYHEGDLDAARRCFEQNLAILSMLKAPQGMAIARTDLASVAAASGDYAVARDLTMTALETFRADNAIDRIATALNSLGNYASRLGEHVVAQDYFDEAIANAKSVGSQHILSECLHGSADAAIRAGVLDDVLPRLLESLAISLELQNQARMTKVLSSLAMLANLRGEPERCARLAGASKAMCETLGIPASDYDFGPDPEFERSRSRLGEAVFDHLLAEGGRMTPEEAVEFAARETAESDDGARTKT